MINVALPKGRLGESAYERMAAAGYDCPSILEKNRKLTFENPEKGVRYFWVKPSDVSIYVERGAADVGIAGKDILLEYRPDVYELLDLKMGKCRMCAAASGSHQVPSHCHGVLRFPLPGHRYHQIERFHRAGPYPGSVRCDRGYCGDGQNFIGKPPGSPGDHCGHQCPVYLQ